MNVLKTKPFVNTGNAPTPLVDMNAVATMLGSKDLLIRSLVLVSKASYSLVYSALRPCLQGIGSKWDPIHLLRGVYTGSDPELLAFTRDRIHLSFMNSKQRSSKPFVLF